MTKEAKEETKVPKAVKFVVMVDEKGREADVHPDEVHNYAKGGYIVKGKE